MRVRLDIFEEPAGEVYRALLDVLAGIASSFSLVWRDQLTFDDDAESVRVALAPVLIGEDHIEEWPGTKLLGHRAWVRRYRVEAMSIDFLKQAPSLFSWIRPSRPEDLALYDESGECILGSIAHERDAWLAGDQVALDAIGQAIPQLQVGA